MAQYVDALTIGCVERQRYLQRVGITAYKSCALGFGLLVAGCTTEVAIAPPLRVAPPVARVPLHVTVVLPRDARDFVLENASYRLLLGSALNEAAMPFMSDVFSGAERCAQDTCPSTNARPTAKLTFANSTAFHVGGTIFEEMYVKVGLHLEVRDALSRTVLSAEGLGVARGHQPVAFGLLNSGQVTGFYRDLGHDAFRGALEDLARRILGDGAASPAPANDGAG